MNKSCKLISWTLVSAAVCGNIAAAGEPIVDSNNDAIESVVVTASRLNQSANYLSQSIEIISNDDIDRLWASSATDVLRQVPGTNVIQQGGRGGVSSILLRGGEPNFTVVLIDGVQVNDPTNTRGGSYDIGNLEQALIEDVEIVFGSMSPVYGSDALSGVVNFITRGAEAGSSVSVEGGTQGYASASAFYGGKLGEVDTGVGVYGTNDDGDVAGADYRASGLNGRFSSPFGNTGNAGLSIGYQETESRGFPEDSGGPELAAIREFDDRDIDETRVGLDLGYIFAERWNTTLLTNYYSRDEDFNSPGIAPGVLDPVPANSARTDFERKQVLATVGTNFGSRVAALIGAEWQNERGTSHGFVDLGFPLPTDFTLDRDTVSAFAEGSVELGRLSIQGGYRWDDPDALDSVTSGRLGLLYRLSDDLTELRTNWGEGFKAPSFFALGHPLVGNPDLKPESGDSLDASVKRHFRHADGYVQFTVFRNEYDDLIDFDSEQFLSVNRDKVVTKGAEAAVKIAPVASLNLWAHVTYLDSDVKGTDNILRGRPEWRGGLVIDWEFIRNWQWVTSVLAVDESYESSVPTGGVWLDSYTYVDMSLTWRASEALSFGLAVDNLLDKDYNEAVGFPAAGRRGRLGARYRF